MKSRFALFVGLFAMLTGGTFALKAQAHEEINAFELAPLATTVEGVLKDIRFTDTSAVIVIEDDDGRKTSVEIRDAGILDQLKNRKIKKNDYVSCTYEEESGTPVVTKLRKSSPPIVGC
ncbi:MAG: hypothetical protein A2X94_02765 [Bdellovibrionales bacterium GWB1_55_8]|nr:MAG: hypothetical protein A2X94_02765 [Bdellovibrionales bacterium GWB1_55_8]